MNAGSQEIQRKRAPSALTVSCAVGSSPVIPASVRTRATAFEAYEKDVYPELKISK